MLIKNDESCNSEKTILRYQENGIADLLASDWYGIMLLSPGGRVYLDNYNDIHGIGNDVPLEFVRNCVEWDSLIHNKSMTYTYKEWNFLIYSIRQTDKGNCVFFLHCRKDKPFDARDARTASITATGSRRRGISGWSTVMAVGMPAFERMPGASSVRFLISGLERSVMYGPHTTGTFSSAMRSATRCASVP